MLDATSREQGEMVLTYWGMPIFSSGLRQADDDDDLTVIDMIVPKYLLALSAKQNKSSTAGGCAGARKFPGHATAAHNADGRAPGASYYRAR